MRSTTVQPCLIGARTFSQRASLFYTSRDENIEATVVRAKARSDPQGLFGGWQNVALAK